MNISKKALIAISITVIAAVIIAATVPFIIKANNNRIIDQYTNENLELYSEINIITDCAEIDKKPHTLAGVKEAVKSGADTVTLDLCFTSDGTPVVTDDYTSISDSTLRVADVFELICREEYKDTKINFRLRQLVTLSVFNRLVNEYDVSKRVIISGIDNNRYSLISGSDTAVKVYFDYSPSGNISSDIESVTGLIADYNLGGIVLDLSTVTNDLIDALSQKGISYIIKDVDSEIDLYRTLSYGAYAIDTDSPAMLTQIYSSWRKITLNRIDASIVDELNK